MDNTLREAIKNNSVNIVKELIDEGVDVNKADKYGVTPLIIAALYDQLYLVKLLLDKGAEVNHTDKYGETPLYVAAKCGQLDVAQLLLDKGAEVNKANTDGATPFDMAAYYGHTEIEDLLRAAQDRTKKTESETDKINPEHYKTGGIETFDYLKAKLTAEELKGFCKGNIIKYITRADQKNKKEDLEKAKWYLEKLIRS